MENVIILGSGVAGLTAALYAARADLSPIVIGGLQEGGQLTMTTSVENFPGFPEGVQGPELVELIHKQAERFGAKFKSGFVTAVKEIDGGYELVLEQESMQTKAIIIATGASARWLNALGEENFKGNGVTTCATCDGFLYRGKEVIVVGGGDSAAEEALFLTKFATKVTLIHRRDALRASKIMQERVLNHEKIQVKWNSTIQEVYGDNSGVKGVKLTDTVSGAIEDFPIDGIFIAIGHDPNTKFLKGFVTLDEKGYLITDRNRRTNKPGVYGAGDVHDTIYKQAITAAGTGCQAAIEVEKYLSNQ